MPILLGRLGKNKGRARRVRSSFRQRSLAQGSSRSRSWQSPTWVMAFIMTAFAAPTKEQVEFFFVDRGLLRKKFNSDKYSKFGPGRQSEASVGVSKQIARTLVTLKSKVNCIPNRTDGDSQYSYSHGGESIENIPLLCIIFLQGPVQYFLQIFKKIFG